MYDLFLKLPYEKYDQDGPDLYSSSESLDECIGDIFDALDGYFTVFDIESQEFYDAETKVWYRPNSDDEIWNGSEEVWEVERSQIIAQARDIDELEINYVIIPLKTPFYLRREGTICRWKNTNCRIIISRTNDD